MAKPKPTENDERRVRRALAREGYLLRKSRFRNPASPYYGGYGVEEIRSGAFVLGCAFEAT